jgi:hypothetical protein
MWIISELVRICLAQFADLIYVGDAFLKRQTDIPLRAWKDERSRLSLWAGNIGAHQTGQSSLEYRLRDASHIRNQIILLLEAIKKVFEDLGQIATTHDQKWGLDDDDDEIQALCEELDLDVHTEETETQQLYNSLVENISQLFEISMTLRNPAQHDRLVGTHKADAEPFKFYFRQHVSHKYPDADSAMVDRISSAMARQKAILKYRERHHQKLQQGLHTEDKDTTTIKLSETVASSFRIKTVAPQSDDITSESGVSSTSYAASLLDGKERVTIPPLPRQWTPQRAFECPYCYFIISIKDRRAWAKHVFGDLSPYICIFPACSMANRLYDSRKNWYNHIRQAHMPSSGNDTSESRICPLCKDISTSREAFEKHVGRHLEELSLFVLPRTAEEEDDNNAEFENQHSRRSSEDTDGPVDGPGSAGREKELAEPNTKQPEHSELSSSSSSESHHVRPLSILASLDGSSRPGQIEEGEEKEEEIESASAMGERRPSRPPLDLSGEYHLSVASFSNQAHSEFAEETSDPPISPNEASTQLPSSKPKSPGGRGAISGYDGSLSSSPTCRECHHVLTLNCVRNDKNGRIGRLYHRCDRCGEFRAWADLRGVYQGNPPCMCGERSRLEESNSGVWYYTCVTGRCAFYTERVWVEDARQTGGGGGTGRVLEPA